MTKVLISCPWCSKTHYLCFPHELLLGTGKPKIMSNGGTGFLFLICLIEPPSHFQNAPLESKKEEEHDGISFNFPALSFYY